MKKISSKHYTARELAERFGCGVKTIHNHANALFGNAKNGVRREFDEAQTTAILERMKRGQHNQTKNTLQATVQGTETALTLDLQIALAEREAKELAIRAKELWKRKALEQEARAVKAEYRLSMARELLDERETGLETYQRIAEAGGLITSDREDLLNTYRRGRQ
jgi:hypothetical protein